MLQKELIKKIDCPITDALIVVSWPVHLLQNSAAFAFTIGTS